MNRKKILIPIILLTVLIILLIILLSPSTRYNRITISQNEWNSIKASRSENENLVLQDIEFNDYNLIIDEKNNTLYYSLVKTSSNKYNPIVSYKTSNKNIKIAILEDEVTDEKVKSNYEFKIMIYDDKEYHIYNLKYTDLPILNITYKENSVDKQKSIPMEIYLYDNLSNMPNKVTISNGRLKINEGSLSFSLNMTTPGKNIRDNKISILNMKPNSKYVLTAVTNSAEEAEAGREGRNNRVNLFINNEYKGVYSLGYSQE